MKIEMQISEQIDHTVILSIYSGTNSGTRRPQSPDHPDPQSPSLSRSYGSNLPTSLTLLHIFFPKNCEYLLDNIFFDFKYLPYVHETNKLIISLILERETVIR